MNYTCKKCGSVFDLTKEITKCPFCGEELDLSDIYKAKEIKTDEYIKLVDEYRKNNNSTKLKRIIQNYKDIPERKLPNFDNVWRSFVIEAAGASEEKKDSELQTFIKNHAREYDSEYNSDLFISVLQAYPKVGTTSDWDEVINLTFDNNAKFSGLCEHLINYIIKNKAKAFAIDIFNSLSLKEEKGIEAGRTYIRTLISSEEIAKDVFTVSAFNSGRCKNFIKEIQKYINKYLKKDNNVIIEETDVWNNYIAALKKQKKRNIIITFSTIFVLAIAGLVTFLYLNAVNKDTVAFEIDKVIETYYGDDLELTGFNVTYKKNSGEEVTENITTKMLKNYDPEKLGEQTVYVEFEGVEYPITIVVNEQKLAKPKVQQQGNYIAWETVLNADSYSIYINSATTPTATIKELSYDLSNNPNFGDLEITVRANPSTNTKFKNSEMSDKLIVKKLNAPQNIKYDHGELKWDNVEGATKYELSINNTPYNSTTNSLKIGFTDEYTDVTIAAIGDTNTIVGIAKDKIYYYVLTPVSNMKYENGNISFDADDKASLFKVYVDGEYWKDFSRKYFNISTDGFLSTFTNDTHKIEIESYSSTSGIEESIKYGFDVMIANHIYIEDDAVKWESAGTGATYFVKINNENKTLNLPYLSINELNAIEGDNVISVLAKYDNKDIILETTTIVKKAKPTISYANGNWVLEEDNNISYKYDNGEASSTLLDVADIADGEHTIKAIRKAEANTLTIDSDEVSLTIYRIQTPVIAASYGEIVSTFDETKYKLDLYYAAEGSDNYSYIDNLDLIINEGNYNIKAKLAGAKDNNDYDLFLDSNYSNVILVKKLAYPTVSYTKGDAKITSSSTNVKYYYLLNDEEKELEGGLVSNLPPGIFDIYARQIPQEENEIMSAPTPSNLRVSVFNLNITLEVNKYTSSQSQFYLIFSGCEEIDSLTFDYEFEYYNQDNVKIGTKTQNNIVQAKGSASTDKIVYLANYRTDVNLDYGYAQKDIKKVEITVKIKNNSGDQIITRTFMVNSN